MSFMGGRVEFGFHSYDLIIIVYYNMILSKSNSSRPRITRSIDITIRETLKADIIFIQIVSKQPCTPLIYGMPSNATDPVD